MFDRIACAVAHHVGRPYAMAVAALLTALGFALWDVDRVNIAVSLVSLALLFLLQSSTNREGAAVQAKLDALIKASEAPDEMAHVDEMTEAEIARLRRLP